MKESSAAGTMYGAAGMEYPTSDGGMGQQQWNGHQLRQRSKRWQQDLARMPEEPSPRWQLQQQSNVLGQQAAAAYAAAQQSLQHQRMTALGAGAEQELNFKGSVCDSADLARKSSQSKGAGQKQKGALGRMASRIYALRPRLLRGEHILGQYVLYSRRGCGLFSMQYTVWISKVRRTCYIAGCGAALSAGQWC